MQTRGLQKTGPARLRVGGSGDERTPGLVDSVRVLDIEIANATQREVIDLTERLIARKPSRSHAIFIVNAHTLNLSASDASYRAVLERADFVLGDGTGVRWAARLRGVRMKENLVGTDLIPTLFRSNTGRGRRYFLLGSDLATICKAAGKAEKAFPGWELAGFHHGHLTEHESKRVVEVVNQARPDVLLVGMGNPVQENWIHAHLKHLRVPVCIGVGGLFDHWAGNLRRADIRIRRAGFEWLQILFQQPGKWRRYLLGNPLFLARIVRRLRTDLAQMSPGR